MTVICGHRGGGGDPGNREALTERVDFSTLGHEPTHYDYRDQWANKLITFARMFGQGVRCFELDLLPCANGEVIITHDSHIDGRNVWEWSTAELRQKGCPTLSDLLELMLKFQQEAGERVTLLLEAKGSVSAEDITDAGQNGISDTSKILVRALVHAIENAIRQHPYVWSYDQLPIISFNHAMLGMAKLLNPHIQTGLSYASGNFGLAEDEMDSITQHTDYDTAIIERMIREASITGAYAINPDERFITPTLIEAAHKAKLRVQSWRMKRSPAHSLEEMIVLDKKMIGCGVDTLITDCPIAAKKLL